MSSLKCSACGAVEEVHTDRGPFGEKPVLIVTLTHEADCPNRVAADEKAAGA